MLNRSIVNVLGCGMVLALLSACSAPMPRQIEISAKPIEKPELVIPSADRLIMRKVDWVIITPENAEEVFAKLEKDGKRVVLFGLTDNGYESIALNLSDLRAYIQQQKAIIAAYEGYYKDSNSALDAANAEIEQANQAAQQPTEAPKKFLGIF